MHYAAHMWRVGHMEAKIMFIGYELSFYWLSIWCHIVCQGYKYKTIFAESTKFTWWIYHNVLWKITERIMIEEAEWGLEGIKAGILDKISFC